MSVLVATVLETPPRPSELRPDVPDEVDDLIMAMLAKAPVDRPAGAEVVRTRIAHARASAERGAPSRRAVQSRERRLFSVVLVRSGNTALSPASVRTIADRHGGTTEALLEGTMVVAWAHVREASEQAVRAARSALAIQSFAPDALVAVATTRGALDAHAAFAFDPLLASSASATSSPGPRTVPVDEVTATLLESRFDVAHFGEAFSLGAERSAETEGRTLLGKHSPFVGRDRELARLVATFDECIGEPIARKVFVTGEAGIGKTRLRHELLRAIAGSSPEAQVWVGRGDPTSAGSAFALLVSALFQSAGILSTDPPDAKRERLLARVARPLGAAGRSVRDIQRVAAFVGEAAALPAADPLSDEIGAARRDPSVMADQVARAWAELIAAETAAHPLVIVLEDLHWGDRASVRTLTATLASLERTPLFLIGFARPEARAQFPELTTAQGAEEVGLRPLSPRAGGDLVRRVLGDPPAETVARLVDLANGNPFFLEELIRATSEGRSDTLPETVLAVLDARLAQLDASARRLLRAASVFGGVFWRGAAAKLLGDDVPLAEIDRRLEEFTWSELVTPQNASRIEGEREYRFRHALVREAAYATLTDDDARRGHAAAGAWLADHGVHDARTLAFHFHRGEKLARAAESYERAAEQALDAGDSELARELAGLGLEVARAAPDATNLGELLVLEAEARVRLVEYAQAAPLASEALERLERGGAKWFAAERLVALSAAALGKWDVFRAALDAVRGSAPAEGAADEKQKVTYTFLSQLWFKGDYATWEELIRDAEQAAPTAPALRARLHRERARAASRSGDLAAEAELLQGALELATAAGDHRYAASLTWTLADTYMDVGMPKEAERLLREIQERTSSQRDFNAMAVHVLLARAHLEQGQFEAAHRFATLALGRCRAAGDRRLEGGCRIYLADALAGENDLPAAEVEARTALEVFPAAAPLAPRGEATLARILLASGRPEEAREVAARALSAVEERDWIEEGEALIRIVDVDAKLACGDLEAARVAHDRARARLLERASRIGDARYRETFLHGIRENARTMRLTIAAG